MPAPAEPLAWEIDVSLFRQYRIVGALARVFGATWVLIALLFGFIAVATDGVDVLPTLLGGTAVLAAALWLLGIVVSAVVFRGHLRMRYEVDADGITATVVDRVARGANRAAVVAGTLAGSASTTGAGLLATSQEQERLEWSGAFRAQFDDGRREVAFRNAWRTLLVVYATPEAYAAARGRIEAGMAGAGTTARSAAARSPLPAVIGLTAVSVAACLALVPAVDAFEVDPFLVVLAVAFAVAGVWLLRLLFLVTLGTLALAAIPVISGLADGPSGDDVAVAALFAIGAATLLALSIAALRGALPSMLERDAADEG